MTRGEKSLLLYLEICLVDWKGLVKSVHMSKEYSSVVASLTEQDFIKFTRLPLPKLTEDSFDVAPPFTHQVVFSEKAWKFVHRMRRDRAETYTKTFEVKKEKKVIPNFSRSNPKGLER